MSAAQWSLRIIPEVMRHVVLCKSLSSTVTMVCYHCFLLENYVTFNGNIIRFTLCYLLCTGHSDVGTFTRVKKLLTWIEENSK